ncbi:hypothetical protein Tco_0719008 [Tanacetum coccineum]
MVASVAHRFLPLDRDLRRHQHALAKALIIPNKASSRPALRHASDTQGYPSLIDKKPYGERHTEEMTKLEATGEYTERRSIAWRNGGKLRGGNIPRCGVAGVQSTDDEESGDDEDDDGERKDGIVRILSPVTAAEIQAVEKERKAKNILLMAIPKEHMRRFHEKMNAQRDLGSHQN